jgi:hypothetical protein
LSLYEEAARTSDYALLTTVKKSLKRIQGLRAALMIDQGDKKDAIDLLTQIGEDNFDEEEKALEVLVFSLISILKQNSDEGLKAK